MLNRSHAVFALLLAAAAVGFATREAAASPTFPDAIQQALPNMPCVPQCVLCHTTNLGGYGTAVTPFAAKMVSADPSCPGCCKLKPAHTETVACALKSLEYFKINSDGDGFTDIEELEQGTNPNGGDVALCSDIGYGCARVAPTGEPPFALVAAALVGLACARRRGHRR